MIIYVDSLITLNTIVDYLVLLSTAKISGAIFSRFRLLIAAAVGAVYSATVLLPCFYFLSGVAGKSAICFLMTAIAFGMNRRIIRLTLITAGVSFAFAGAAIVASMMGGNMLANISTLYIPVDLKTLLLITAIAYVVLSYVYKKTASQIARSLGTAEIAALGKIIRIKYLCDTGNALTDPMTNAPVTVVSMDIFSRISGLAPSNDPVLLLERLRLVYPNAKTRLIPFNSVGKSSGLMLALKCDSIKLDGREIKDGLIAFSPNRISSDGSYEAISGLLGG
ncbi:MAG: hypothetical protein E7430_00775 [Ruminococcaceae bacterium]|nr:hypothetical protein [Oscillospiraceae bacterium]